MLVSNPATPGKFSEYKHLPKNASLKHWYMHYLITVCYLLVFWPLKRNWCIFFVMLSFKYANSFLLGPQCETMGQKHNFLFFWLMDLAPNLCLYIIIYLNKTHLKLFIWKFIQNIPSTTRLHVFKSQTYVCETSFCKSLVLEIVWNKYTICVDQLQNAARNHFFLSHHTELGVKYSSVG